MKESKQGAYKLWNVLPEESSSSYKIATNTNAITKMRWARIFESTKVSGVINENDCIRRLMIIYKTEMIAYYLKKLCPIDRKLKLDEMKNCGDQLVGILFKKNIEK